MGHKAYELPGVRLCDVLDPSREDLSPVEVALYREESFSLWSREDAFREMEILADAERGWPRVARKHWYGLTPASARAAAMVRWNKGGAA